MHRDPWDEDEARFDRRQNTIDTTIPDVRDGLTRLERVILVTLKEAQEEMGGRNVPTAMLYGRVCERIPVSQHRFQQVLNRLVGC